MTLTAGVSTLLTVVLIGYAAERSMAFSIPKILTSLIRSSASTSSLSGAGADFLHEAEYPGDDFTHILGFSDCDHEPSKLQQIASHTLKDVTRNKIPLDTVSLADCRQFMRSSCWPEILHQTSSKPSWPENIFSTTPCYTHTSYTHTSDPIKAVILLLINE